MMTPEQIAALISEDISINNGLPSESIINKSTSVDVDIDEIARMMSEQPTIDVPNIAETPRPRRVVDNSFDSMSRVIAELRDSGSYRDAPARVPLRLPSPPIQSNDVRLPGEGIFLCAGGRITPIGESRITPVQAPAPRSVRSGKSVISDLGCRQLEI